MHLARAGLLSLACLLFMPRGVGVLAEERAQQRWSAPVVMETATVRGKVAILETRREDRKTLAGLKVQIWGQNDRDERRKLISETECGRARSGRTVCAR